MPTGLEQAFRAVKNRIYLMIGRGILDSLTSPAGGYQLVKAEFLKDEVLTKVDQAQPYGFEAKPLKGAEVFALFENGNRNEGFVISISDAKYRPRDLGSGDVEVYSKGKNYVRLYADGTMAIGNRENGQELFEALYQIIKTLSITTVMTLLGPQPLSTAATLIAQNELLAKLKGPFIVDP